MLSYLIIALAATFVFGFFVVRGFGAFLDENNMDEQNGEDVEK